MIKAIRDFPLYNDDKILINYKSGDTVEIKDKALVEKLILSGKCELHDPREAKATTEKKVLGDYEKKVIPPAKKRKKRKK